MYPFVSIIVPIYKSEQYLRQCLDSILAQTFADFECILVNDCSPDNSPKICDEYSEKNNRVKVIHNKNNMGSSLSRKIGFENSCGAYILFIDSDDYIEKDMVEILYNKASSENCDIVVCDCFYEKEGRKNIYSQNFSGLDKMSVIKDILALRVKTYLFNKLIKRDLYFLVEFPEHSCSEDYVITIQNICNSRNIGYINIPLYNYRYNAYSLSNDIASKTNRYIEANRNWRVLLVYLKKKYGDLRVFEPELSWRLNYFEEIYRADNDLKNIKELKELFSLYTASSYSLWKTNKIIKGILKKIVPPSIIKTVKDIGKRKRNLKGTMRQAQKQ